MMPLLVFLVLVSLAVLLFGPGGFVTTLACFVLATAITALLANFGTERRPVMWSIPIVLAVIGCLRVTADWLPSPLVAKSELSKLDGTHKTLFVLVHGVPLGMLPWQWSEPEKELDGVCGALAGMGDMLVLRYPSYLLSNADPEDVAIGISEQVETAITAKQYDNIIMVGFSMGAPIARKAFLYGLGKTDGRQPPKEASGPPKWPTKVDRIVLLAGMNRGWDISGQKPMDMTWYHHLFFWVGSWLGELTGTAKLCLEIETGAPFIANLRLEWMRWSREAAKATEHADALADPKDPEGPERLAAARKLVTALAARVHIVQLLGDIDDFVSDTDNKDLRASASPNFTWIRVRGTGHGEIIDFADSTSESDKGQTLGEYRKEKFLLAATKPLDEVRQADEEQRFQTDNDVTHVVFVVHGIRDLGRWSAGFEKKLTDRFPTQLDKDAAKGKLRIASIRYGYFGMGPFIIQPNRQKYVRWFMDEYTETIARFPNATRIDFIGHSNGTYLLASALEQYRSLQLDRVVFAGSVVRRDYDWDLVASRNQFKLAQNYVADDDWVVALFPRFFEQWVARPLKNYLGSAGFNGFDSKKVTNIEYLSGQHAAFLTEIPAIADFILPQAGATASPATHQPRELTALWWVSQCFVWLVWLILAACVIGLGLHIAGAARQYALLVGAAYTAVVIWILYEV